MKQIWRCETSIPEMLDHLQTIGRAMSLLWAHDGNVTGEAKTATRKTIEGLRQMYWFLASMRDPEECLPQEMLRHQAALLDQAEVEGRPGRRLEPAAPSPIRRYEDDEHFIDP